MSAYKYLDIKIIRTVELLNLRRWKCTATDIHNRINSPLGFNDGANMALICERLTKIHGMSCNESGKYSYVKPEAKS